MVACLGFCASTAFDRRRTGHLRRYYNTGLRNSAISQKWEDFLIGHTTVNIMTYWWATLFMKLQQHKARDAQCSAQYDKRSSTIMLVGETGTATNRNDFAIVYRITKKLDIYPNEGTNGPSFWIRRRVPILGRSFFRPLLGREFHCTA